MKESAQARVIAGKYELEKLLGQGGMGDVWVAKELASGQKIALKLLKSSAADSKENRARFEREAHIAATLVSPHIAQVTDSGVDEDGAPFMALELLHGEDLQQRIKTEKGLPLAQVVRLAIQVGRALHVAHTAGLVHRDLKPANIFLARQGDEEIVKVLDFGIAKASSSAPGATEYTTAGAMLGTASYMSPEQIRNAKTVDHRADLWAFSVVLFRSLTGQFPFSQTGFDLFLALMEDPIPAPLKVTSLVPDLPAPLNVFFERSFVRDLSQRYATASAAVVGFCRAAGVTVPADVLHAADAPAPSPRVSTNPSPGLPQSPVSAGAARDQAGPLSATLRLDTQQPPSNRAAAPTPAAGRPPVASPEPELDASDPDNAATVFYQPAIKVPPPEALESPGPASGGPADGPAKPRVFTYSLDAARASAPELQPGSATTTSDSHRLAQAAHAARLSQPESWQGIAPSGARSRAWLWIVIGIVLAAAAAALFFFLRTP